MPRLPHGMLLRLKSRRSIRVRLTLWYVGLLAAILAIFGTFLYLSLMRSLQAQLDDSLRTTAAQLVSSLEDVNGTVSLGDAADALPPGTVAALYDASGHEALPTDTSTPQAPLPPALALATHSRSQSTGFISVALADGSRWRVYAAPIAEAGGTVATVRVARSEADLGLALRQLVVLMLVAIPVLLLVAIAGGLFLAGRALGPIEHVTRMAAEINAADLSRRLNFGADDEVGRLAAMFDQMLDRLEAAFAQQRQFTADASHELRTPLALLQGQIDLARQRRRSPAAYDRLLASLSEDTTRLSQLLGELLGLSRADAGQENLSRESVEMGGLATEVVDAMQPLAVSRGVALRCENNATRSTLVGDQTRLAQVLVNLLDNAIKYTPDGGTVTVILENEADDIVIRVADTGVGIPPEHLPHVLERFYRVDSARSRQEGGSGLGLAICKWIVEAHAGRIEITSELGRGTTFAVRLPAQVSPGTPTARPIELSRTAR